MSIPGYRPDPLNFSADSHRCAGETGPLCWRELIQQELPSLHSLWAATVCYCGTAKCQCCHDFQIWMNIEPAWLISWLLKQIRDPTRYDMYPPMAQCPCIYISILMVWSISQHIWQCYADQPVLIRFFLYMYMLWPLNSWANDDVTAYIYIYVYMYMYICIYIEYI